MEHVNILSINPGSTSTKLALFRDMEETASKSFSHSAEELAGYKKIFDQKDFRTGIVRNFLEENGMKPADLDAVVGRGGLLTPMKSGTYKVTPEMLEYLKDAPMEHASNIGSAIAAAIAEDGNIPAFIVDPVVVDELEDVARITGVAEISRKSIFHALNHKAIAREAATKLGKKYEDCNMIIAHLGGGISVGAHNKGLVVDVNNALNGDGPITPERAGSLPAWSVIEMALSGEYTTAELKKKLTGRGGVVSHLNLNDMRDVEKKSEEGDEKATMMINAMAYTIAKEIGSMAAVLKGKVDAVVLTGGIAYSKLITGLIRERVEFIGEFMLFPGEDEMAALAKGAYRVLKGEEEARTWEK